MDFVYASKCDKSIDKLAKRNVTKQISQFFDQLDTLVDDLNRYSMLIGDSRSRSLIDALQIFKDIKTNVCGTHAVSECLDEYYVWQDFERLQNILLESLGFCACKVTAKKQ